MSDKKKKKAEPKKSKSQPLAKKTPTSKIKRAEEKKNPKLPKDTKIPKGVSRTVISDQGNIIMTITERDLTGKKTAKRTVGKPEQNKTAKTKKPIKPKSAKKPAPKKAAKPETSRLKAIKHDSKFELGTDEDRIIVIGSKAKKPPRRGKRQLKRVANLGGYTAWDGRTGKTFATKKEANAYALDVLARTGELIPVTHTQRTISHTFNPESESESK